MTTLSFYARGDGSSANNAALNVENPAQQQTVLITFDSGEFGDIILDPNGGAPDPDTTVIIDGVSYNFVLELTGNLPLNSSKVPDELEGLQVIVISVEIDGSTERFFFVTDGSGTQTLMDGIGNGAIALDNADFSPPTVLICFCRGTKILTPSGLQRVETLNAGDYVLNNKGEPKQIRWIASSDVSSDELRRFPDRRPICIAANSIAARVPFEDLHVSPQHRVVIEGIQVDLLFDEPRVLLAAKHLIGLGAERNDTLEATTYYHLLLEDHDMVVSNGLASESVQLSPQNISGMSFETQISLSNNLDDVDLALFVKRQDALPSLKSHEALVLVRRMFSANASTKPPSDMQSEENRQEHQP